MTGYFVCCIRTRLARQKATWYITALTVPQMWIASLRVLVPAAAGVTEWRDSS